METWKPEHHIWDFEMKRFLRWSEDVIFLRRAGSIMMNWFPWETMGVPHVCEFPGGYILSTRTSLRLSRIDLSNQVRKIQHLWLRYPGNNIPTESMPVIRSVLCGEFPGCFDNQYTAVHRPSFVVSWSKYHYRRVRVPAGFLVVCCPMCLFGKKDIL